MKQNDYLVKGYKNTRNPILPLAYHIPDGEAHRMPDGRLYIYGSMDVNGDMFCSACYVVVSTEDMEHWEISSVAFTGDQVPWFFEKDKPRFSGGIDWEHPTPFIKKMIQKLIKEYESGKLENRKAVADSPLLFAPDCIHKDGKYYLYFCMQDESEGVAIADTPYGPFENPIQLPCGGIDPAIFIDTDGVAYYYWGQLAAKGVRLNEDMVSFNEEEVVANLVTEEEHFFHEGSSMRRIGDTYYLVYSSIVGGKPTSLDYATSRNPLGPFTYRGTIINNEGCDPASWNNHGSIEKMGNQWYVFYHRCSRGVEQYRRLCVEPIQINEDGSIDEVKMTSQGVGEPFSNGEKIFAYQACELKGTAYIDVKETGDEELTHIGKGDELVFRYLASEKGFTKLQIEATGEGELAIFIDRTQVGNIHLTQRNHPIETVAILESRGDRLELKLVCLKAQDLKIQSLVLS